jgi:hypothetical protein
MKSEFFEYYNIYAMDRSLLDHSRRKKLKEKRVRTWLIEVAFYAVFITFQLIFVINLRAEAEFDYKLTLTDLIHTNNDSFGKVNLWISIYRKTGRSFSCQTKVFLRYMPY